MTTQTLAEVQARVHALYVELFPRKYDGKHGAVLSLVEEVRMALTDSGGKLGPWEAAELDYALVALNSNFLSLALVAINKAIEVNRLPRDEYDYGFHYTK